MSQPLENWLQTRAMKILFADRPLDLVDMASLDQYGGSSGQCSICVYICMVLHPPFLLMHF